MNALLARLLTPVLAIALVAALGLAGWQWVRATKAEARTAAASSATERVRAEFATYRETQERNARAAQVLAAQETRRQNQLRQEAIDAEHTARIATEADRDRLRAGNGQLQRYATDLATSLGDRARDPAAARSCSAAEQRIRLLAEVLGEVDQFAAGVAEEADQSWLAGQLCERTYDALTK